MFHPGTRYDQEGGGRKGIFLLFISSMRIHITSEGTDRQYETNGGSTHDCSEALPFRQRHLE